MRIHPRLLLAPPITALLSACAPPPSALGPTLQAQSIATAHVAAAYSQDLALLRAQTEAMLSIRRTTLRGDIHRSLIQYAYLTPTGEPDTSALDHDLADPDADSPLVQEIRAGAMTRDQAAAWLHDYALALKMTDIEPVRLALLARLSPLREFEFSSEALLTALDLRAREVNLLFADLDASSQALAHYAAFTPAPGAIASEALRRSLSALITEHITDPARRAAALELLAALLTPMSASTPLALTPTE